MAVVPSEHKEIIEVESHYPTEYAYTIEDPQQIRRRSLKLVTKWRPVVRKRGYEQEAEKTGRFSAEVVDLWEAGRAKASAKRRATGARNRRLA